jgi:hypothetical protein
MSAVATAPSGLLQDFPAPDREHRADGIPRPSVRRSDGDRLTLSQRLECTWEGLSAAGAAECPVCAAPMRREAGHGRCGGCGSRLA